MSELRDKRGMTEEEAIADYRRRNYPKPALTADCAIFARVGGRLRLLMIRRGGHPCLGCWALPGGFADEGETIERTAERELEEETGLTGIPMALVGIYSAPGRDRRGWTVSAAYAACLPDGPENAVAGDDAAETAWVDVRRGDDGRIDIALPDDAGIAFDHRQIIEDAVRVTGIL